MIKKVKRFIYFIIINLLALYGVLCGFSLAEGDFSAIIGIGAAMLIAGAANKLLIKQPT